MMLNETKLNPKHKIEFQNYNSIRQDRPGSKQGGGTAILIHNKFKYEHIKINKLQNKTSIETTIIKINLKNHNNLYLIAIYCQGSNDSGEEFEKGWKQIFDELELASLANYFVIAGDLNAKHVNWGNTVNNNKGYKLNQWLTNDGFTFRAKLFKPDAATYTTTGSYLDLAVADARLAINTNQSGEISTHSYDSDHKAIEILINTVEISGKPIESVAQQRYNFRNTNWTKWTTNLQKSYNIYLKNNNITSIIPNDINLTNPEIENGIENISKLLMQNLNHNAPKIRRKNNMECYTNATIEGLYKYKSRIVSALKRIKRTGTGIQHINTLKAEIKRTNELITQNIKIQINEYWKNKLLAIRPGNKMFPNIKQIIQEKRNTSIKLLEVNEDEARNINTIQWHKIPKIDNIYNSYNTVDNLNIIGHYIEKNTVSNNNLGKIEHTRIIQQKLEPFKTQHAKDTANHITKCKFSKTNKANNLAENVEAIENYFITSDQIKTILKYGNSKKSYGPDEIPNIILKHLPDDIIAELCTIFNNLLNNKTFPKCWKIARIYPIPKKGNTPLNPTNYRPISLLSNIGKIYEIIINNKIQQHVNNNGLNSDNQFGFKQEHSTIHAVTKLTSDISYNLNKKCCTGAVFIDMKKAFESVWLDGLLFKLQKMKFDRDLLSIIMEMLYNRQFIITNGTENSSYTFNIYNGLQQGTINAPILFNLYSTELISNEKINNCKVQTIAYADDIVIYTSAAKINIIHKELQDATNFICDYLQTWRIQINESKCETIIFRRPYKWADTDTRKNWKNLNITINNANIPQRTTVKYLGINIDQYCYIYPHIKVQLEKAKKAFMSCRRIFYSKFINQKVKRICYQSIIRPILTYGCPIWFNCNPSYMECLRKFERKCIRHCRGQFRKLNTNKHYISNQKQYNDFETDRIDLHIIKLIRNHIKRATTNVSNSLIYGPYFTEDRVTQQTLKQDKIPGPESFIFLDKNGYIQDINQVPLIYHIQRRPTEKGFDLEKFSNLMEYGRYSTAFKRQEYHQFINKRAKYWWLQHQT